MMEKCLSIEKEWQFGYSGMSEFFYNKLKSRSTKNHLVNDLENSMNPNPKLWIVSEVTMEVLLSYCTTFVQIFTRPKVLPRGKGPWNIFL
jgi:hypothetical protein